MRRRERQKITNEEFAKWAADKEIQYASETVWKGGLGYRLRFAVTVTGVYRVTIGNLTAYEGFDFYTAAAAYATVQP